MLRLIAEVRRLRATQPATARPAATEEQRAAAERLQRMVEAARAGKGEIDPEAVRREVALLRAGTSIAPAAQTGQPDLEWREEFHRALEAVRAGVPEEWSEEELQQRIEQAVAEVRAGRAGHR